MSGQNAHQPLIEQKGMFQQLYDTGVQIGHSLGKTMETTHRPIPVTRIFPPLDFATVRVAS
jgi:hypothetical protein